MRLRVVYVFWCVILSAVIVFASTSLALARPPQWRLASDFLTAPHQSNPDPDRYGHPDTWEFLQAPVLHHPPTYRLLGKFIPNAFGVDGLEQWQGPFISDSPLDQLPAVGINATGAEQVPFGIAWPSNVIRVHPFSNDAVAVGWRSPVPGYVRANVGLSDLDAHGGDGFGWFVDEGRTTLASDKVPNGGSDTVSLDVHVRKGTVLYFIVTDGGRGDDGFDSTGLSIDIHRGLGRASSVGGE